MIKTKTVCICDICGKIVDAVARSGQYNETEYDPPKDWSKGPVNNDVDICPECLKKLHRPLGTCRDLKDTSQLDWGSIPTTSRGGIQP